MSSKPKLEQFYIDVLDGMGLTTLDDGRIGLLDGDSFVGINVEQRQLVLPTREILKSKPEFWDDHIAFHPLCENVLRNTSPVLEKLVLATDLRLTEVLHTLMHSLTVLAADKNKHPKLKPDQHRLLDHLKAADAKTVKFIDKVLDAGTKNAQHRLLFTNVKSGGKYKGEKWQRVCARVFPLFSYTNDKKNTIFNIDGRVADVKAVPELFKYILPDSDVNKTIEAYNFGSNANTAPSFHALSNGFILIAERLNAVVETFKDHLEDHERLTITLNWKDSLKDINTMKNEIPNLEGSKGTVKSKAPTPAKATISKLAGKAPSEVAPKVGDKPPVNSDGTVEFRAAPPTQMQAPVQTQPVSGGAPVRPTHNPFAAPQGYPQPQHGGHNPFAAPQGYPQQQHGAHNPFAAPQGYQQPQHGAHNPFAAPQGYQQPQGYPQPQHGGHNPFAAPQGYQQPQGYPQPQHGAHNPFANPNMGYGGQPGMNPNAVYTAGHNPGMMMGGNPNPGMHPGYNPHTGYSNPMMGHGNPAPAMGPGGNALYPVEENK